MATATINTIEDLIRVLDENPEWLEAMRARLLTRELIELPRRFAEFAASTDQRFDEQGRVLAQLSNILIEHTQTLAEHNKTLAGHTQTLAEHGEAIARLERRSKDHTEAIARLERRSEEHSAEFVAIRRELKLLRDDVGDLKGPRAEEEAAKDIAFIAEELGLDFTRVLTRDDLLTLLRAQPLPDLSGNVRNSFTKADIVAEAADQSGETRYIAVEVSYTVNGRDTERAVRNAAILARLTGKPARAVVAGYRVDDRVRAFIESGEVFWRELER